MRAFRRITSSRQWRRRLVIGGVVAAALAVSPFRADAVNPDPAATAISDGLQSFTTALERLQGLEELANAVPGTEVLPTGDDGLRLAEALRTQLKDQLANHAYESVGQLDAFLDDPDGNNDTADDGSVSGVAVDVTGTITEVTAGSVYDVTLQVALDRDATRAIALPAPEVDLGTGDLQLGLHLDTTLPFRLDMTQPAAEQLVLRATTPPTVTVSFDADRADAAAPFVADLGLAQVSVDGTIDVAGSVVATIADPDRNERITAEEWANTSADDLFDLAFGASHADAALTLRATDLPSVAGVTATVTLSDTDLTTLDAPTVQLGGLSDLRNMTPIDFLSGIGQVASSLQALQVGGPAAVQLPFIEQNLGEVVAFNRRLADFFVTNGLSQQSDPFAITAPEATLRNFDTIQEIAPALATALEVAPSALAFDLDPATHRLTYNLRATPPAGSVDLGVDIADELQSIGLTAVDDAAASASLTPTFAFDIGVGVNLDPTVATNPSLSVLDKVFFDTTGPELTADFPVVADLNLTGRVGFLGLELTDANTANSGTVPLVGRADPNLPMLALDITGGSDERLTIAELFQTLQTSGFGTLVAGRDLNVAVPATTITAAAKSGSSTLASGSFTVGWDDVEIGAPQITQTGSFETEFLDFAFDPSNPTALFTSVMDAAEGFVTQLDTLASSNTLLTQELPFAGRSFDTMANRFGELKTAVQDVLGSNPETIQHLETALETRIGDVLQVDPAKRAGLLGLDLIPATATERSSIQINLHYGLCHRDAAGCNDVEPLNIPFNLGNDEDGSGVVGISGQGNVEIDYRAIADLTFGVELPEVTKGLTATSPPTATGSVEPYLLDSSSAGLTATVTTPGQLQVGIGAAHLYIGSPQNPAVGRLGVDLTLKHDPDNSPDRVYLDALGTYFSDIVPTDISPATKLSCAGVPGQFDACGKFPVYLSTSADPIGTITFTAPDLETPSGWDVQGLDTLLQNLIGQGFDWQLIVQGLQQLSAMLDDALQGASYGSEIPIIGGALDSGVGILQKFNAIVSDASALATDLSTKAQAKQVEDGIAEFIRTKLEPAGGPDVLLGNVTVESLCDAAPGGTSATPCADDQTVEHLNDVQVRFTMGQLASTSSPGFDLGFPGLRIAASNDPNDATDDLRADAVWAVDIAFGVSIDDGFYLLTNNPGSVPPGQPELRIDTAVHMPLELQGDIAFIPVRINDRTPNVPDLTLGLRGDLAGGGADSRLTLSEIMSSFDPARDLAVTLTGNVSLRLALETGFLENDTTTVQAGQTTPSLPVFKADFELLWGFGSALGGESLNQPLSTDDLTIAFRNVRVDLGSVIGGFLKPIVAEVNRIISPAKPVLDILTAPIPGVKEIAEIVGEEAPTILSILELQNDSAALQVIRRIAEIVRFFGALDAAGQNSGFVLGDFGIDKNLARNSTLAPSEKGDLVEYSGDPNNIPKPLQALGSMAQEVTRAKNNGGFSLPAFEHPEQLFQLLVGKDVDIVKWDAGDLEASARLPLKFGPPIGICPCSAGITISFGIRGHLEIGYDTRGIREAVKAVTEGSSDAITTVASLFQGIYLGDLRGEVDVPEITLFGSVAVSAALDVGVAEAGIRAGISARLDLNLHDGGRPVEQANVDGKLYIDEIARLLPNPICLFDADGAFSVFVELYADTFLTPEVTHTLVGPIDIIKFTGLTDFCDVKPDLAHVENGRLVLHIGQLANLRGVDVNQINENLTVRQLSADKFSISGFGVQEEETGVTHGVFAAGFNGNDTLAFLAGGTAGTDATGNTTQDNSAPVVFCGGAGNDRVTTGNGADTLVGDGNRDGAGYTCTGDAGGGDDVLNGGGGDDIIRGNGGADKLVGGAGGDNIAGGDGDDQLQGVDGDDTLSGGDNADVIYGGKGNDTISGGSGNDVIEGLGSGTFDSGSDTDVDGIDGGAGEDNIFGGPDVDTINGDGDNDVIRGGDAGDIINGNDGHDDLFGDAGSDTVNGGAGHDDIVGGIDTTDAATANSGDSLTGGDGVDLVLGDDGVIERTAGQTSGTIVPAGAHFGNDLIRTDAGEDTVEGGNGDDDIAGGADVDALRGGAGGDLIHGDGGGDFVFGDSGADRLHGDDGVDEIRGGFDDDHIWGNADNDKLFGDSGADTIRGNTGDDEARGSIGGDCIEGNEGLDTLHGEANGDTIAGGGQEAGAQDVGDMLFGGGGNDTIAGDNATICGAALVLHDVPFSGVPFVPGTFGSDTINPGEGDDIVYGQSADETINGGLGDDYIEGNAGQDVIHGDDGDDDLIGGSGYDFGGADGARRSLATVHDESVNGLGDTIDGDAGIDHIAGDNAYLLEVDGTRTIELHDVDLAGDAVVVDPAASGNDLLRGGLGADVLYGQGDDDQVFGGDGDDYAEGNNGLDLVGGDGGQDDLVGGSGRDNGNGGYREFDNALDDADILRGGADHDVILGDNAYVGRPGGINAFNLSVKREIRLYDVEHVAGPVVSVDVHGDETQMDGGDGDDLIFGQGGNDLVEGAAGHDYGEGNSGADVVKGGVGGDDLVGGSSAHDGVFDLDRDGTGTLDESDTIYGELDESDGTPDGSGGDVVLGDNATVNRVLDANGLWVTTSFNGTFERQITTADVELVGGPVVDPRVHGDERLFGNDNDDLVFGQGGRDYIRGGSGDDALQGNHDADTIYGGPQQDDAIGGTFAPNRLDKGDFVYGDSNDDGGTEATDGHDVLAGDNAIISRPLGGGLWIPIVYGNGTKDRITRTIQVLDVAGPGEGSGSDLIRGGGADDDIVGQFDDGADSTLVGARCYGLGTFAKVEGDLLCGDAGEDAIVGDMGTIVNRSEDSGARQRSIKPQQPFLSDVIFEKGSLTRLVTLTQIELGGNDVVLGGPDGDKLHGGSGDDLINGNAGDDAAFGDDGIDAAWGGAGHDHLYGGHGGDFLDINPRVTDPASWKVAAPVGDNYQDLDYIYGGWDQDAMQANISGNGPAVGDRLLDWVGAYNAYYVCAATYGDFVITRAQNPGLLQYLNDQASGDGAVDTTTPGASGFREVAIVHKSEEPQNSNPPHPDNVAHFTCT